MRKVSRAPSPLICFSCFFLSRLESSFSYKYYLPRFVIKYYYVLMKVLETNYDSVHIIVTFYSIRLLYSSSDYRYSLYFINNTF